MTCDEAQKDFRIDCCFGGWRSLSISGLILRQGADRFKADQNEKDHAALVAAVKAGRIKAVVEEEEEK